MAAEPTLPIQKEFNPWLAAEARFDEAAARLGLDEGMCKVLRTSVRELTVHIPVQLDDGRLEVFTGYRVQHSIARGPGKGGQGEFYGDFDEKILPPSLEEGAFSDGDNHVEVARRPSPEAGLPLAGNPQP